MFAALGRFVAGRWAWLLPAWFAAVLAVVFVRPSWEEVTADGEFAFLPAGAPSLRAERLFRGAFSDDLLRSSVVLVFHRPRDPGGLGEADDAFLRDDLLPELRRTLVAGGFAPPDLPFGPDAPDPAPPAADPEPDLDGPALVASVLTPFDRVVGSQFRSEKGGAALVVLGLTSEFGEARNVPLVAAVEDLLDRLVRRGAVPAGLELAVSGTATVGRDVRLAEFESGEATETATLVLVVGLLLVIYRAPLLALIPLATVFLAVQFALGLLSLAAEAGWFDPFAGLEVYVSVVTYGAGVDYCMFLTARYREEVDRADLTPDATDGDEPGGDESDRWGKALANAVRAVGPALAASAGTTAVGIGMMGFAEFAKFRQAGVGICVGLLAVTVASLTFAPAALRGLGRWAFWPRVPHGRPAESGGWLADAGPLTGTGPLTGAGGRRLLRRFWERSADRVCESPGRWLGWAVAAMLPLAAVGAWRQGDLTYGLLSELPADAASVRGAQAVQAHFPAGETGPLTVLVSAPPRPAGPGRPASAGVDFGDPAGPGRELIGELSERLWDRRDELGLAELRSLSHPLGVPAGTVLPTPAGSEDAGAIARLVRRGGERVGVRGYYVADAGLGAGRITRVDVVFADDPFSRGSLDRLDRLRNAVRAELPPELAGADLSLLGATASVRDLAAVTDRDRLRINLLVLAGVLAVLVLLLRRWALSLFLVATVVLGYLTTLGAASLIFQLLAWFGPGEYAGLDWKVPVFLFTILVAVGEDYNIYLVTRADEERAALAAAGAAPRDAALRGVRAAVGKTGAIISGCGLIMAGTFASLTVGELAGMVQLGVALALGVLLDTFLIRPVLVPAYLVLLHSGRLGRWGTWLGAAADEPG